jgi:peptide/nickel transport system substrate-binding protein
MTRRPVLALAAAAALTAGLSACGSGSSNITTASSATTPGATTGGGQTGGSSPHAAPPGAAVNSPHRGGTLTMLWSGVGSSIDTALDYDTNWFLLRMTNDGLITTRTVGGTAGNQLVPDLATSIPKPTDGGRTYVFTLRRGVRFSDGHRLTPADVRYSLEREFKIPGPGTTFYTSLVGATACLKTPKTCDLSKGVVANPGANTVTFHLTTPDPNFLQELSLPFADIVPTGTPEHDIGTNPLPATGPYEIQSYKPNQSMTFVRNPDFHQWSAAAQPDGYPNRIDLTIGLPIEDATTEVEKGQADWMYDNPPTDRLNELATKFPSQIHISETTQVYYMALDTKAAPFDNLKARQALNFAVDRAAVIGLFGGRRLGTATCQILPPSFPGYAPYCPYTTNPGSGHWTAPDLAKARQLVAASGTKGDPVSIISDPDDTTKNISLYFVSLLDKLGYHASLKTLSSSVEYPYVQNSSNKPQIDLSYWSPDYNAPSDFLNVSIGCAGYHPNSNSSPNLSEFCDPAIQKMTAHALKVQTTDPQAADSLWAKIDQATTDQAPEVPLFVANKLDLVSKRLGNYQFSPAVNGRFLIDQAWVK